MLNVLDVAQYFLGKDESGKLFNKDLIRREGRTFYEGNARLNKFLHLAQNLYIAKTGCQLLDADFYAYDNGAVVPEVQEKYSVLLANPSTGSCIESDTKAFLDQFYNAFKNAPLEDLIELSHEDNEWICKHGYYDKEDQKMDSMSRAEEYKQQYADVLKIMERMQ